MNKGLDAMRGLQGHSHKTAHTCSFRSGRICPGASVNYERRIFAPLVKLYCPSGLCIMRA